MSSLPRPRRALALLAVALGAFALAPRPAAQTAPPARPRLLVLVVVDQMRADYLTRLASRFNAGFRRLLDEGAVFEQAFYPYLNTVTCAGHATIGTGALPKTHGAILNQWYDREARGLRTCTDDATVSSYTYGHAQPSRGHSAAALRVPTLGERLRQQWPDARVVTFSMKARSALMMAGKGATAATWLGARGWQSSTAFGPPRPELTKYIAAHPYTADDDEVWDRLLPLDTYTGADAGVGERPEFGWTRLFPHPLGGAPGRFHDRWEESPYSDAYLGRMAEAAIREFRLGQRDAVDLLGVSFSATDLVGHAFGPESHEVQDTLLRLDRTLGALLTTLDTLVGRDGYVLGLSADHGVARIPEATRAAGGTGGRVPLASVRAAVEKTLAPLGQGPHVDRVEYTQIYLTPAARARATAATLAPAIAAVKALPGVGTVVWHGAIDDASNGVPAALREAVRNSYDPERSGDLSVVPAEHWILVPGASPEGGDGTTHGTPHSYDQHVPLVLLGRGFPAGRYAARVSPADIAPTLAHTVGLVLPGVEGRVVPLPAHTPQ
jgi:hypothetical protein